ncbi:MAG: response regulator [Rhodocyclales bacterium]|nr:response regulator [Rhodocyclales bacterium]
MSTKRTFRVAMLGLTETEQRVLKSIARISSSRASNYEFVDHTSASHNDVVIVDGDSPQALQSWRSTPHQEPAVFVGSTELEGEKCLKRPIMGARLLVLLDEITSKQPRPAAETSLPRAPEIPADGRGAVKSLALVVDDSPTVRKHIEQGLAPFGLKVHFAETGEEALDRLASASYDIVFLDVVLPGIDGYAVCKAIKKDREMKATPVIMLTGKSSTFDRIKGSLAGCDTYLTKPVEYELFQNVVKKYIGASLGVMPALTNA